MEITLSSLECGLARLFKFRKDPGEAAAVTVDFTEELPVGVYISSAVVTVEDRRAIQDVTGSLSPNPPTLIDSTTNGNDKVSFPIVGGSPGRPYRIKLEVTLDDPLPQVSVRYIEFRVQAPRA